MKKVLRWFIILLVVVFCNNIKINASTERVFNDNIELNESNNSTTSTIRIDDIGIDSFSNVKYISNANYFKANPYHAINDGSDNGAGTCTTVAMQMLMGYHNYYTDRRLIPPVGGNGLKYLSNNYANELDDPLINPYTSIEQGRESIGTEVGFYEELMDFNSMSGIYGIGQAVGCVARGAISFVNTYAPEIKDNVTIESDFFDDSTAKLEIDSGRPIILGCKPSFANLKRFHVVVAYGYATYDGKEGFVVHCGWQHGDVHVWYPSSWFGFQIKMDINHKHNIIDSYYNVNSMSRRISCDICEFTGVDNIYEVSNNGESLIKAKYSLKGDVSIPDTINGINILSIGYKAFYGQKDIINISIPNTITSIGESAFENCSSLQEVKVQRAKETITQIETKSV